MYHLPPNHLSHYFLSPSLSHIVGLLCTHPHTTLQTNSHITECISHAAKINPRPAKCVYVKVRMSLCDEERDRKMIEKERTVRSHAGSISHAALLKLTVK